MFNLFKRNNTEGEKLFFTTDVHCHVVPGIDDGASTLEKGVKLVKALKRWGIDSVIATPHIAEDTFPNSHATIEDPFNQLKEALEAESIDVKLSHSAEYRIDDFALSQIEAGDAMTFGDNYLLIENSFVQEPWNLDQTLFQLKVKGYKLVFAHPERYTYYHHRPQRYIDLHTSGMYFQINLLSLAGYYGKEVKRMAEWLIDRGIVDFIGTDIHRSEHVRAIDRYLASRDYQRHRRQLESTILNDTLK